MAACGTEETVCTTAGPCQPKYLKNKTISGQKIKMKKLKTKTTTDCWTKCAKNAECKYVTWVNQSKKSKQKKVCTFYSALTKTKKKKGTTVGMCK